MNAKSPIQVKRRNLNSADLFFPHTTIAIIKFMPVRGF